jgi:hypothetical protein
MRAPLTFPAALVLALLAAAPVASALTLQTSRNPDGSTNLTDPDANPPVNPRGPLNMQGQDSSGSTFHIGNSTLHFGVTGGAGADPTENRWFLDNPASRTVPSQMR